MSWGSSPLHRVEVARLFPLKPAGAGFAGRPTRLSLVDRDLVFQDRKVVAAGVAPTPPARIQSSSPAMGGGGSR
jgi:hypothetical protein